MHCLAVLYPTPENAEAFRDYYIDKHLPLAKALPGLIRAHYAFPDPMGPGEVPFCIFQAFFVDPEAMGAALDSEVGKMVAADVLNYSPTGATLYNFAVIDV